MISVEEIDRLQKIAELSSSFMKIINTVQTTDRNTKWYPNNVACYRWEDQEAIGKILKELDDLLHQ